MSKAAAFPYPVGSQAPNTKLGEALASFVTGLGGSTGQSLTDVDVTVPASRLLILVQTLVERAAFSMDMLRNIAGVDLGDEGRALKYHFYSFRHGHSLQVTVPLPAHEHPHVEVPSLVALFPAADWHEREAAEMFGIDFLGHPNLKNLLLEEDLHIHPLLKAHPLQVVEILQGIEDGPAGFKF
ncbi:MAG: NADH-quinone oxidoreductase subunit C [Dehalococcoidia bacterium]